MGGADIDSVGAFLSKDIDQGFCSALSGDEEEAGVVAVTGRELCLVD